MAVTFGLASFKNQVAGLHLQTVTYGETASTAEAIDEDGNIEQVDVYAKKRTIQCEGNVVDDPNSNTDSLSALTVGGDLTVDGNTYKIDSVSIKESVNGHKTASISGSAPIAASGGGGN